MNLRLLTLILLTSLFYCVSAQAQWTIKDNERRVALIYGSLEEEGLVALVVTYPPSNMNIKCRPIVSILLQDQKASPLRNPLSVKASTRASEQMVWVLDGVSFTSRTEYHRFTNGFEIAMFVPDGLIDILPSSKHISVITRVGGVRSEVISMPLITDGFIRANNKALRACRR